ncbi:GNAT superfamily N-acetyltransferase [Variovorax paradoxus]|uniref:N-acetyltransferase n=1 Tax=Variovorax atrisoli TaxID=3394203 RepID=UPI00119B8259|nr:N-acetyltransferase [Variovorax paradoxus]MDR6519144.1 GNAT superfamily N-acetyltransferase [Variovorax paradoxus]
MTMLALPFPFLTLLPGWRLRRAELRIDVAPGKPGPADTLAPVHERMRAMHDRLREMPGLALGDPGLRARFREADGELYVYIEDLRRDMLVGYTVFNRLIELSRRADRHVRAPHSQYHPAWQRRGLASAVYRWALDRGICLMSGARQSPGAHALWQRLACRYEAGFADLRCKQLNYLGREIDGATLDALHTRMFLIGEGWTLERFRFETQMG